MSQPYIGEIRMFAGNFAPQGWAFCDGSLMSITDNPTLFNLIGTTYGGDGQNTFALPDLRGRLPIHQGSGFAVGQNGGVEQVTLTANQIPVHTHPALGQSQAGNQSNPKNEVWANSALNQFSSAGVTQSQGPNDTMNAGAITSSGGNQPHDNLMPFLAVSFIISLFGIYPSPT